MNDELTARQRAISLRLAGRSVKQICSALGRGETWFDLEGQHAFLKEKVDDGLKLTNIRMLLRRRGVEVHYRTLYRYCATAGGQLRLAPILRPRFARDPSEFVVKKENDNG